MSFIDRVQSQRTIDIITGDGRRYSFDWKNAERSKKYNYAAFNFINVPGTRVVRGRPEGAQYTLELYFTGADYLDNARNFEISADDQRPWTVIHPFYDRLIVQPLSINRDDKLYNRTIFIVKVWETIGNQYPVQRLVPDDNVGQLRMDTTEQAATNFAAVTPTFDSATQAAANNALDVIDNVVSEELPQEGNTFANFKQMVGEMRAQLTDPLAESMSNLRLMANIISFPIEQVQAVNDRIQLYSDMQQQVIDSLVNVTQTSIPQRNKRLFEFMGSAIATALFNSAITPGAGDYQIRTEVASAAETLNDQYALLIETLERIQTDRPDDNEAFTADDTTARIVQEAFGVAQANLFDQAFEARQERVILLEYDDNAIRLTHRFYGLDANDENLEFFINTNGLSLDELLQIKKGREIRYYV